MKSPLLYLLTMSFICMADTIHPNPVGEVCGPVNRNVIIDKYVIEKERDDICISYPMILGLDNAEIINKLVREHIYKVIDRRKGVIRNYYNFKMRYKYEVEFLNDKFLSIRYEGWWEAKKEGIRRTGRTHTVNIDIEEEKIVSKEDMVKDSDQVFEMLMENEFESIPLNGKKAKPYYSPGDFRELAKEQADTAPYAGVEDAEYPPKIKEEASAGEHGKNTVTRGADGKIAIHITTKEPDRENR